MKRSVNTILLAASALVVMAIVAILLVSLRQTQRVQDTSDMVTHTQGVIFQTEKILTLAIDNVTITRGYLLTGGENFQSQFQQNKIAIAGELSRLRNMVSDNRAQLVRLDTLEHLLDRRVVLSDSMASLRNAGKQQEAVNEIASGKGIAFLDSIRQNIGRLQGYESQLLETRKQANEAAVSALNTFLLVVLSVVFLVLILLLGWLRSDMAVQKRANDQADYLATLVSQVPDAIISVGTDRKIKSWNRGAEQLYGFTSQEAIHQHIRDLLKPVFTHDSRETVLDKLGEHGQWQGEQSHHRKDGSLVEVWITASQIVSSTGEITGTVNIIRDITEKKRVEKKLRDYNEQLSNEVQEKTAEIKEVFERVNDGFLALDNKKQVTYINRNAARLLDCPPERALGRELETVFPALRSGELQEWLQQASVDLKPFYREEYIERLNKWLEINANPSVQGTTLFMRDITNRKKAQQALRESEEKYYRLIEQASDGIFVADSQGNFIDVNTSACQLTGYSSEELLQLNWRELLRQDSAAKQPLRLTELVEGMSHLMEGSMIRKGGRNVEVEISAKKLPDGRLQAIVRDITERRRAKEALEESEAKFKSLVEQSLVGVYIIQDGRFAYVNPQMAYIHGYTIDEMMALPSIMEVVDEGDREKVRENLGRRLEGNTSSMNYEFSIRKRNGEKVYVEVFGNRTFYNGRPAIIGTAIDNTERKRAEREIEISNERFMLIAKATNDAMWDWDLVENQIWWNEKHYQLYGHDPNESPMRFQSWQDRIHPDERQAVISDLNQTIAGGETYWEKEYRFLLANGEFGTVFDRVYIVYKGDKPIRMLGSLMDITQRIKAEEQVKASEKKYKLLFENNPMPMWMLSLPDRRFLDVNQAAIRQYGYTKEEFLELDILRIRPEEDIPRFIDQTRKPRSGINHAGFWRHRKKSKELIDVEIITHEIQYQEQPAMLVLSIDVTEKLRYEQEIKEARDQLRELSAHLQDIREEERLNMAREIHDELGQLLTVLKMDVSWLNKKLETKDERIVNKIGEILELLDKTVKTVRRIATELRPSILDDLGLLPAMEWQAEEFEQRSGIPVNFRGTPVDIPIPSSISISLFRIFQESLTNIARHARARQVSVTFGPQDDSVYLCIEDDGRGFDDSQIRQKKTLGLLGMKERAIMAGGRFDINSRPGEGTRIEIKIPTAFLLQTQL